MDGAKDPSFGPAARRFLASMNVAYDMWHDGVGYDLDALSQLSPDELKRIEQILVNHQPRDWRGIEALAQIDSPAAREAVAAALDSRDATIRSVARQYAGQAAADPAQRERLLIQSLENDDLITSGLGKSIDEAATFHPPAVMDALFRGALNRPGEAAVHFAALLMHLHGKAPEPFDWAQRPFFLRFNTPDRREREAAFRELCEKVGVDPGKYLHHPR
jgi:hypothetical protein